MSEYVDVAIIENGKVIGSFKALHKTEEKAEKGLEKRLGTMGYLNKQNVQKPYTDGFTDGMQEREKENAQFRADYDKQKEINKELVDDIADLHKRIRELETQIKQMNEREAQDIRARFPC